LLTAGSGKLLPRANPAACPQLAKADFAFSSQHVRDGQRMAALDAQVDALQQQAVALGADTTPGLSRSREVVRKAQWRIVFEKPSWLQGYIDLFHVSFAVDIGKVSKTCHAHNSSRLRSLPYTATS
jgi:hypothetical protein